MNQRALKCYEKVLRKDPDTLTKVLWPCPFTIEQFYRRASTGRKRYSERIIRTLHASDAEGLMRFLPMRVVSLEKQIMQRSWGLCAVAAAAVRLCRPTFTLTGNIYFPVFRRPTLAAASFDSPEAALASKCYVTGEIYFMGSWVSMALSVKASTNNLGTGVHLVLKCFTRWCFSLCWFLTSRRKRLYLWERLNAQH